MTTLGGWEGATPRAWAGMSTAEANPRRSHAGGIDACQLGMRESPGRFGPNELADSRVSSRDSPIASAALCVCGGLAPCACSRALFVRNRGFYRAGAGPYCLPRCAYCSVAFPRRFAAAIMAAPVQVSSPAGALTKEAPIFLHAAETLVANTQFLPWLPVAAAAGGPALVSLDTFQAVRVFLLAVDISPAAPDVQAAAARNPFTIRLTDNAWSRIFTELKASGYAAAPITSLRDSDRALIALTPVTPANLQLIAADWHQAEAFAVPAAGGGGGGVNAVRRAVLQPMAYLSLVTPNMLQLSSAPRLKRLCDLVGYLGPCLTQASRYDEVGTPAASASRLAAYCGPPALSDGLRARNVARALDRLALPTTLRSLTVSEFDLASELEDGIVFHSSAMDARSITEQRILCLAPRCGRPVRGAPLT